VLILGALLALAVGAGWASTGKRSLLVLLGVVILLMIGGLVAERLVVTDREAIENTLTEIARDVKENDLQALVRHIYSGAPQIKAKAEAELPNYTFKDCRVTKIHSTDVDPTVEPRSAIVEFNIIAEGSFREGGLEYTDRIPRWVRLHMVQEKDGRWTVQDYKHEQPQQMMFSQPLTDVGQP